jgi:hypothetical protein
MKRRKFLQSSGSALALAGVPALLRGKNLNSAIQLAAVGTEGRGGADLMAMASHSKTKPVAFCEVDLNRTSKARALNKDAPVYQDFREMLEEEGDKIDAVTIGIPDHMHAIVALDALRRKKHVFCQKPLTHTVWEARQVRLQAEKSGVITRATRSIPTAFTGPLYSSCNRERSGRSNGSIPGSMQRDMESPDKLGASPLPRHRKDWHGTSGWVLLPPDPM